MILKDINTKQVLGIIDLKIEVIEAETKFIFLLPNTISNSPNKPIYKFVKVDDEIVYLENLSILQT